MFNSRENLILVAVLFFLSGVYIFVFSESGALERIKYDEKRSRIIARIDALKAENRRLEGASLSTGADRISSEDLARYGYVKKGSKLIYNKNVSLKIDEAFILTPEDDRSGIEISHLRVIWIVISSLVLLLMIGGRYRKRERNEY